MLKKEIQRPEKGQQGPGAPVVNFRSKTILFLEIKRS
jgi:hypothetical protein